MLEFQKNGAKALKSLEEFRDDFVFDFKYTNKNILSYEDNMKPFKLVDYTGKEYKVFDKYGCVLVPTTYVLGKSEDYENLIESSNRAIFKEVNNGRIRIY